MLTKARLISLFLSSLFILQVICQTQVKIEFTNSQTQFGPQISALFQEGVAPQGLVINIYDSIQYQKVTGFGAGLTDTAAFLISKLPNNTEVMTKLFDPVFGIGINYIRLPISASDLSLSNYTYSDLPNGQTDPNLAKFSIDHDKEYIIPLLQSIKRINPNIKIMATPWSAPAWMKNIRSLIGLTSGGETYLAQRYYTTYANYLVKVIQAYRDEDITIDTLTIQNEPLTATPDYPSMIMEQEAQLDFLNNYLTKAFLFNNITTKVLIYDDNWNGEDYPAVVYENLNSEAKQIVAGVAFHCYAGDVSAQTTFRNQFPEARIYLTECSGGDWAPDFADNLTWDMQNIFIGAVNNWAEVSMKRTLALDQNHGPQNGGCSNCRGLLTINTDNNEIDYNVDYYTVGIFSKNVQQGATRIKVEANDGILLATGFNNPDNSKTIIVLNQDWSEQTFSLQWNNKFIQSTLPGGTVGVYRWNI